MTAFTSSYFFAAPKAILSRSLHIHKKPKEWKVSIQLGLSEVHVIYLSLGSNSIVLRKKSLESSHKFPKFYGHFPFIT